MMIWDRAIVQIKCVESVAEWYVFCGSKIIYRYFKEGWGCSYMKGGPFGNRMLRSSLMLRKMVSPILKHNVSVFYSSCRRKIFSSCDLLFSFRLLCSEPVSFVSSVPKCLKVSQNGPKWLFLSLFVSENPFSALMVGVKVK